MNRAPFAFQTLHDGCSIDSLVVAAAPLQILECRALPVPQASHVAAAAPGASGLTYRVIWTTERLNAG